MATRHYYVDPSTQVADPRIWTLGQEVSARDPLPNGRSGFRVQHLPSFDLYEAIEDSKTPGLYERWLNPRYTLTFEGVIGDQAARVREAARTELWTLQEVYDRKRREIGEYDQQVRYNAVDSALSVNWWLIATQSARFELEGIQGNWLQRQIDGQGWPGGPNAPWVGIFNASSGRVDRFQITDSTTWGTLYLEKTQHDQATGNATDSSVTALDAAYGDGTGAPGGPEWQAVAAHDPQDPAWGYPPTVELPPSAQAILGV